MTPRLSRYRPAAAGFALLEVLVAAAVLLGTAALVSSMQLRALRASEDGGKALRATLLARDYLARSALLSDRGASPASLAVIAAPDCRGAAPCGGHALRSQLLNEWLTVTGDGGARGSLRGMRHCMAVGPYSAAVSVSWPASGAYTVTARCAVAGTGVGSARSLALRRYRRAP